MTWRKGWHIHFTTNHDSYHIEVRNIRAGNGTTSKEAEILKTNKAIQTNNAYFFDTCRQHSTLLRPSPKHSSGTIT